MFMLGVFYGLPFLPSFDSGWMLLPFIAIVAVAVAVLALVLVVARKLGVRFRGKLIRRKVLLAAVGSTLCSGCAVVAAADAGAIVAAPPVQLTSADVATAGFKPAAGSSDE